MLGKKFGRLTVVGTADRKQKNRPRYACRCDCGKEIEVDHYKLLSGHTTSCSCAKIERLVSMNTTHGMTSSPEYKSWQGMHDRCANHNSHAFHLYGGRGIRVCEHWNSFENFLADIGPKPSRRHSIDRIDNNGNYEPSNCRWATPSMQQNNRRDTRKIHYLGAIRSVQEISRMTGIPQSTTHRWLVMNGKSVEDLIASRAR